MSSYKGNKTMSVQEAANVALGLSGFDIIDDTTPHTPTEYCYIALKTIGGNVDITTGTSVVGDDLDGETLYDPDIIFGCWTTVTRAGTSVGKLYAYRGVKLETQ